MPLGRGLTVTAINNAGFRVGDIVTARGRVLEVHTEQVGIQLFSKTDEYCAWVRNDEVTKLVDAEDADQPEVGQLVAVPDEIRGVPRVFQRCWENQTQGYREIGTSEWYSWRELKGMGQVERLYREGEF